MNTSAIDGMTHLPPEPQACIVLDMNEMLHEVAYALRSARKAQAHAMEAARRAALKAIEEGWSEAGVARTLDVNRMTVRKWVGKR